MVNRIHQIYEEYWSYTAAKTDLNSKDFLLALNLCVDFLNNNQGNYEDLQKRLSVFMQISLPSTRKMINQFVKLGFLKPYMWGYYPETLDYIEAKTDKKRQSILSKVVYKYSNFNNSMTSPDSGGQGQINFFLKTLEEVGSINTRQLTALMLIDIRNCHQDYLTSEELENVCKKAEEINFIERKYNQVSHLKNLLGKLDDLKIHDEVIYFKTDALRLFGDDETRKMIRDPYLQRVYKTELEQESCAHFGCKTPKCMLEGLSYPVLIASHIKPYSHCYADENAQFNVNNGLLLSKNTDSLFDLGYMTFDDNGNIIPSLKLHDDIKNYLSRFRLHTDFINPQRMGYMKYHRDNVFEKRFKSTIHQKPPIEIVNTIGNSNIVFAAERHID